MITILYLLFLLHVFSIEGNSLYLKEQNSCWTPEAVVGQKKEWCTFFTACMLFITMLEYTPWALKCAKRLAGWIPLEKHEIQGEPYGWPVNFRNMRNFVIFLSHLFFSHILSYIYNPAERKINWRELQNCQDKFEKYGVLRAISVINVQMEQWGNSLMSLNYKHNKIENCAINWIK